MKIILGSQSKGRAQMLREMGVEFETMSADIDEKAVRFSDPRQLTSVLANAKADELLKRIHEPAILITSDQVVAWNGEILEKPESLEEAKEFLRKYNQAPARTVTAVVVVNTQTGKRVEGMSEVGVYFKHMSESQIEDMTTDPRVFTWAGAFSVLDCQERGLIERLEGPTDSVVGLPKDLTRQLMQQVQ
jgi:septum formation protein